MMKHFIWDNHTGEIVWHNSEAEAISHLEDRITEDADEGIVEEHKRSFVGVKTHEAVFPVIDKKENYPCKHKLADCCDTGNHEGCPDDCDEEAWPHSNDWDYVVDPKVMAVDDEDDSLI